jgi:hypothetical protein
MYEMARFGTNFKQVYFAVLPYKYVTEYKKCIYDNCWPDIRTNTSSYTSDIVV